jgi:DnaA family protein
VEQLLLELAPTPEPTLGNFHPGGNATVPDLMSATLEGAHPVLYLWGLPGSGKSHLLRAANAAARSRGLRSLYVAAGNLAIIGEPDLLTVDDVEELSAAAQIALFDAFNRMRATGGVIVASGAVPPTDLRLREDLRTRIASGVVMQLHPLSEDEKRAVLAAHARQLGLSLAPEILDTLIARFARDLGSLIAAIDALDQHSLRTKRPITLPLLRELMRGKAGE